MSNSSRALSRENERRRHRDDMRARAQDWVHEQGRVLDRSSAADDWRRLQRSLPVGRNGVPSVVAAFTTNDRGPDGIASITLVVTQPDAVPSDYMSRVVKALADLGEHGHGSEQPCPGPDPAGRV